MAGVFFACTLRGTYTKACFLKGLRKMTKKSIIISIISVICLVGIAAFVMYGCSGGKENEEKSGASGQLPLSAEKRAQAQEMHLLKLWV